MSLAIRSRQVADACRLQRDAEAWPILERRFDVDFAHETKCYVCRMMTVRARVKNGRLVVDEPTDLPEGTEVELAAVDADGWTLPEEDRAELRRRIESGESIPAAEALARIRG